MARKPKPIDINKPRKHFTGLHLQQLIAKMNGTKAPKSVSRSNTQTSELCELGQSVEQIRKLQSLALERWKRDHPLLFHFALFQFHTGCRVSEVLSIHSSYITKEGSVYVKGLKGSADRVLKIPEDVHWWIDQREKGCKVFGDLDRFHIYREYRKQGISAIFGKNEKASVTHLPRHVISIDHATSAAGSKAVQIHLGHKDERSAETYTETPKGSS